LPQPVVESAVVMFVPLNEALKAMS